MIKLCAKTNDLRNFAWFYMILSNLSYAVYAAKNNFSHFSPTGSLFGKSFSFPLSFLSMQGLDSDEEAGPTTPTVCFEV